MHGNAEAADSVVAYDQGCKAQESLRCNVKVWDEATMSKKTRTQGSGTHFPRHKRDLRTFGGSAMVFSQWRFSSCANEVNAYFKAYKLWEHVQVMHLSTNMRVHLRTGTLAEKSADVLLKNG